MRFTPHDASGSQKSPSISIACPSLGGGSIRAMRLYPAVGTSVTSTRLAGSPSTVTDTPSSETE
ncbi:hypothetical protein ACMHYB_36525 [Sorangium sp. So ce1128]